MHNFLKVINKNKRNKKNVVNIFTISITIIQKQKCVWCFNRLTVNDIHLKHINFGWGLLIGWVCVCITNQICQFYYQTHQSIKLFDNIWKLCALLWKTVVIVLRINDFFLFLCFFDETILTAVSRRSWFMYILCFTHAIHSDYQFHVRIIWNGWWW